MHDGEEPDHPDEQVVVRKRRKGIYILPNLFTLAALFGGFYAIVMAINGRFDLAAVGVFCAMVLDSPDEEQCLSEVKAALVGSVFWFLRSTPRRRGHGRPVVAGSS